MDPNWTESMNLIKPKSSTPCFPDGFVESISSSHCRDFRLSSANILQHPQTARRRPPLRNTEMHINFCTTRSLAGCSWNIFRLYKHIHAKASATLAAAALMKNSNDPAARAPTWLDPKDPRLDRGGHRSKETFLNQHVFIVSLLPSTLQINWGPKV